MSPLRRALSFGQFLTLATALVVVGYGQEKSGSVERGKYIVESVVFCERCHTPRDEQGNPDRGRWLMGGPLQIKATYPAPNWAVVTPRLAGQPPGTDAEVLRLLTTGIWKTGSPPAPPMPPFHMNQADAQGVLAYLKSLRPTALVVGREGKGKLLSVQPEIHFH